MKGTYETTHQRILSSGLKWFLENGFECTNLRDMCADAGITTGSFYRHFETKEELFAYLVQPAVDEIRKLFADAEPKCQEVIEAGHVERLWTIVDAEMLLDYIYRNFDALKLLLKSADGTAYSGFLDEVVSLETGITLRSLAAAKRRGLILTKLPSEPELHLLCHAYISSLFEAVMHDFSREEMDSYIHTVMSFFTAGSHRILGIL